MHAVVDASALKQALKGLQPRGRYKSMQESSVTATAGGAALLLAGTLDSRGWVDAVVHEAGSTQVPLGMAIRLLGTYAKGSTVAIRSEPGAVFFDKLRFTTR